MWRRQTLSLFYPGNTDKGMLQPSSEPMFILKIVLFHILFIIWTWLKGKCAKGTWSLLCENILLPQQSRTIMAQRPPPRRGGDSQHKKALEETQPLRTKYALKFQKVKPFVYWKSASKSNWRLSGDANRLYALKCHDPGTHWRWVWSVHCWSKAFIFSTNLWLCWTSS